VLKSDRASAEAMVFASVLRRHSWFHPAPVHLVALSSVAIPGLVRLGISITRTTVRFYLFVQSR